jgi:hypothetical protein
MIHRHGEDPPGGGDEAICPDEDSKDHFVPLAMTCMMI